MLKVTQNLAIGLECLGQVGGKRLIRLPRLALRNRKALCGYGPLRQVVTGCGHKPLQMPLPDGWRCATAVRDVGRGGYLLSSARERGRRLWLVTFHSCVRLRLLRFRDMLNVHVQRLATLLRVEHVYNQCSVSACHLSPRHKRSFASSNIWKITPELTEKNMTDHHRGHNVNYSR